MSYLPLVDMTAKYLARVIGWANWEDLRQDGVIGLIKAISRFDASLGVPFRAFANPYIRGAIFDSSELTRELPSRQQPLVRKLRQVRAELFRTITRIPRIEEIAEKAELTIEQTKRAIDAEGIAFSGELPDDDDPLGSRYILSPKPERTIFLREALAHLDPREQEIIRLYYWEGQRNEDIARKLKLMVSNIPKIRQRAIGKLRKVLDVQPKGELADSKPTE